MTQDNYSPPRLVIAAPQGHSGKTTVTLGLCSALRARGLAVQPFKKGPDYIDPSWLSEAAGRPCRCLDPFFYNQTDTLIQAFVRSAQNADLSLIEGNHGLFDSFDETGLGSTAAVARTLRAPILLVINAARLGRSAAAIVHGCQTFEPDTNIAAVILNNVAQGRHEARIRAAIEAHCGLPVIGAIPRDKKLTIPDRHLGLIPRAEQEPLLSAITTCRQAIENYLDLDLALQIARSALPLSEPENLKAEAPIGLGARPRIGILRDPAFTFYYPENLEALEDNGAELVFINALADKTLPSLHALYIGGGFPEIFMQELSANVGLRAAIKTLIESGLPVYAECAGMMYLSQRITWNEKSAEMLGVLPCEIEMTDQPQGHGYVIAEVDGENPFFAPGTILRGHEFHNSRLIPKPVNNNKKQAFRTVYKVLRGKGLGDGRDGVMVHNVLASYTHLHAGCSADWAKNLLRQAQDYQQNCQSE